jgi:hypothetical protein
LSDVSIRVACSGLQSLISLNLHLSLVAIRVWVMPRTNGSQTDSYQFCQTNGLSAMGNKVQINNKKVALNATLRTCFSGQDKGGRCQYRPVMHPATGTPGMVPNS